MLRLNIRDCIWDRGSNRPHDFSRRPGGMAAARRTRGHGRDHRRRDRPRRMGGGPRRTRRRRLGGRLGGGGRHRVARSSRRSRGRRKPRRDRQSLVRRRPCGRLRLPGRRCRCGRARMVGRPATSRLGGSGVRAGGHPGRGLVAPAWGHTRAGPSWGPAAPVARCAPPQLPCVGVILHGGR